MNEIKYIDLFGGVGGFSLGIERSTNLVSEQTRDSRSTPNIQNNRKESISKESISKESISKECDSYNRTTSNEGYGGEKLIQSKRNISDIDGGRKSEQENKYSSRNETYLDRRFRCVAYYEIDKYAVQTYNKNFGTSYKPTDITKLQAEQVPDHDLLCAGFPCQSFSIAGKRKGFSDTRGTMFFEICRIIKHKRPRLVWLENVKGLLNHDEGRTFATILRSLDELGYDAQWQVCNSKHFGVPQNRERVFIIASLRGTSRPKVFPFTKENKFNECQSNEEQGRRSWVSTIDSRYGERWSTETYVRPMRWSRTDKGKQFRREAMKEGKDLTPFNEGHRELVPASENVAGCVTHALNKDSLLGNKSQLRRLTPIECEFLQSFPRDWTKYGLERYINLEAYYKYNGKKKKADSIEILQTLWKTIRENDRERWWTSEFITFFKKEILQPILYEEELQVEVERGCFRTTRQLQSKAINYCNRMFSMWTQIKLGYSPQRQKQIEQQFRKLTSSLQKLPHKVTSETRYLEQEKSQESYKEHQRPVYIINEISDTQRYKQMGNAVTVNVIESIARRIIISKQR